LLSSKLAAVKIEKCYKVEAITITLSTPQALTTMPPTPLTTPPPILNLKY